MWCTSSDAPRGSRGPHHRIVRIPPGESVVLNSAERAPYLLLIEILHDDLDFEPLKRSNKEVLKKIVIKEEERKGGSKELIPFTSAPSRHKHHQNNNDYDLNEHPDLKQPTAPLSDSSVPAGRAEEEEMDLVEQLYGSNPSLRACSVDLSDSIVLPAPLKNKELDMATWSRSYSPNPETNLPTPQLARPAEDILPTMNRSGHVLSLDEYSERMKTAAIMLAQLNASLVRESVTPVPVPGASVVSSEPTSANGVKGISMPKDVFAMLISRTQGPTQPNSSGNFEQPQPTTVRMKLQYYEAAAIRDRIMKEMLALEEERMERMRDHEEDEQIMRLDVSGSMKSAEDENIIRRELNKADPSAVVFSESWIAKKVCVPTR